MDSNHIVLIIIGLLLALSGLITINEPDERAESIAFTAVGLVLAGIGFYLL